MAYAFISYQTNERHVAVRVHDALTSVGIQSFMAHEHIQVSEEWRLRILQEISVCDIFLCILSQAYLASPWCVQESGISAVRSGMAIIPLSIDGTIPPGFIGNIQSTRVDPNTLWLNDLIPGLAKHDFNFTFGLMLNTLARSRSFRGAEEDFRPVLPYLNRLSPEQAVQLLRVSIGNGQVLHADLCATQYLPPLARAYGHLLTREEYETLNSVLSRYAD
ncbi:toll/interleukin-1 receptor domain-containing protein [Acidithiobacillus ferrivorans]|uniref:toll/interleukin-1 receptor domain-containing protein n=1 Tax=Acidithiobacillus ferrivorans TaxID=160808 RepID=UPI001C077AAC|nr:toll/interleukin-1 receptor domain-containing protein [Acidithiobacillus ferrivorans]MBU2851189.1 toll/interleukin-1 receptor domain-containing protein [Acidithiobacillus ferrivorans]